MDESGYEREKQTLEELLDLMREHDLDRLKVKLGEEFYEIVRREAATAVMTAVPAAPAAPGGADGAETAPVAGPHVKKVVAPLTGLFFRAPSPDAEPYVDAGDRIDVGEVLCILEAMKLFNEIQSDYTGTIVRVLPQNGELVAQGAELFWIDTA